MADDVERPEGRPSAARRAVLGAAGPLVGYFDRRFQDVHEHIDRGQPAFDRLAAELRHELSQTRTDVAADTDTIAELAFTLERFADLFTSRMEELAGHFSAVARAGGTEVGSSIVELPFAFANAAALQRGASVAAMGDDGRLAVGLAALGLRVTALEPVAGIAHPDVAVVDEPVGDWAGPGEPFDAVVALTPAFGPPHPSTSVARETLDRFPKWLRPTGLLVLAIPLDTDHGIGAEQLDQLVADWDVERDAYFEQDTGGAWRRRGDAPDSGIALITATPRA
jgi:hypothetical protein